MKQELDQLLCEKYPKIMVNRHKPMTETCMCWGFSCGDGWFNIIDKLCANIQSHIDWRNRQRNQVIEGNTIRQAGQSGNAELFADLMAQRYGDKGLSESFIRQQAEKFMTEPLVAVPDLVPQVTLDQVKEKFGTLSFYYTGGDDTIYGMVRMAESMSAVTCEFCGNPGQARHDGWIKTLCDPCHTARQNQYNDKE